jgi:uncharacterized membrane protein YhaH (DUF805 family)
MSEPLTDATESVIVQEPPADAAERLSRRSKDWFAQARWLLFSFSGRINRGTFLLCIFLVYAVPLSAFGLVLLLFDPGIAEIGTSSGGAMNENALVLGLILAVPIMVWINLAMTFKRLHDYGASLQMFMIISLVNFIPYIGGVVGLFLLFRAGDSGQNIYGDGPGWRPSNLPVDLSSDGPGERAGSSILSLR